MKLIFFAILFCSALFAESSTQAKSTESKNNNFVILSASEESPKKLQSRDSSLATLSQNDNAGKFIDSTNEDELILEALDALDAKDDKKALQIYERLYKSTKKAEYLKEQIFTLIRLKDTQGALKLIADFEKIAPNDLEILKTKALLLGDDIDAVLAVFKRIVELEDNEANNILLANLFTIKNDAPNAKKHLLRAYQMSGNEKILLLFAGESIKSGDFKDASALIKAHFESEMDEGFAHGILEIAASFGALDSAKNALDSANRAKNAESTQKNLDSAIAKDFEALFLHYFKKAKTPQNAKNLAKLYFLQNKLEKITALAQEFNFDDEFLIDIYIAKKDYKNAKNIAKKALKRTKDNHYLGVLAIIEFESSDDKAPKIPQIAKDLELALKDNPNHIFANYLGYLLIDYEIDTQKGIAYVKQALDLMPQNPAYLDSLAWGYFKQGKCAEASATMEQIPREIIEREAEIKGHLEEIKKCLEKS